MNVTLVFDNTGAQSIDRKHILKLDFERLRRCFLDRFKGDGTTRYNCSSCDMIIAAEADKTVTPDIPIIKMEVPTVFNVICNNTIIMVEILDDTGQKTIYLPSKVVNSKQQKQKFFKDKNLHIHTVN